MYQAVIAGHWSDIEMGMSALPRYRDTEALALSPDGRRALVGGEARVLQLWDLENGILVHTFEGNGRSMASVVFTSNGRYALSGGDRTVNLWRLPNPSPAKDKP